MNLEALAAATRLACAGYLTNTDLEVVMVVLKEAGLLDRMVKLVKVSEEYADMVEEGNHSVLDDRLAGHYGGPGFYGQFSRTPISLTPDNGPFEVCLPPGADLSQLGQDVGNSSRVYNPDTRTYDSKYPNASEPVKYPTWDDLYKLAGQQDPYRSAPVPGAKPVRDETTSTAKQVESDNSDNSQPG